MAKKTTDEQRQMTETNNPEQVQADQETPTEAVKKDSGDQVNSPELSAKVPTAEAIREKIRLYPKALTQEIVAMFELEGVQVSSDLVQQIKEGAGDEVDPAQPR
jgi:hypothetical protein